MAYDANEMHSGDAKTLRSNCHGLCLYIGDSNCDAQAKSVMV